MMTLEGIVTREPVDVPTALFELNWFLAACERIKRAEIKGYRDYHWSREYDRLVAEKEAKARP